MDSLTHGTGKPALALTLLISSLIFTSCAGAPNTASLNTGAAPPAAAPEAAPADNAVGDAATSQKVAQPTPATPAPRPRAQLIKKAAMSVTVDSVDKAVQDVSAIVSKQQGDVIGLDDQKPDNNNARHTASMQIRVPQNLLEATLSEIAKLGTVDSRTITADDVGNQLVDLQARLTNLRKTEANLQKIMDKAGSVRDIMSVSKELSNVRQSIEQIDAQLKNLQNQVSYSTITLKLEAAVGSTNPQRAVGSQVQETWNSSTNSVGKFTVGLLKLGIWLIAYSPYLLILAAAAYGFNRMRRRSPQAGENRE
jgi:archaellum component FlaC